MCAVKSGNLASSLRRHGRDRPMERYDRLPPALRRWLAAAALPWSAQSALRLWSRYAREVGGDTGAILMRLDRAERRMLARDCPRVWGKGYPAAMTEGGAALRAKRSENARLPDPTAPGRHGPDESLLFDPSGASAGAAGRGVLFP